LFSTKLFDKGIAATVVGGFTVSFAVASLFVLFGLLTTTASAQETDAKVFHPIWRDAEPAVGDTELDRFNRALVDLANQSRSAIVQIRVTGQEAKGSQAQLQASRGSGFIIDPKGFILTAQHVIDKAKEVEIRLADGQRLPAHIIAADGQVDVAILKIQTEKELPVLSFTFNSLRVGDLAVVFGYPFGRESSMNLGIISRSGRVTLSRRASIIFRPTPALTPAAAAAVANSKGHVVV
jgi:S1-C subfamily serine protease